MRIIRRTAPLACAAVMVACGGTDGANRDRPAQSAESARQIQQVTLTGCVQTGPARTTFVLENVRMKDAQQPVSPQSTLGEHAALITEGSWVRLSGLPARLVDVRGFAEEHLGRLHQRLRERRMGVDAHLQIRGVGPHLHGEHAF
jgi:hypothetical protein